MSADAETQDDIAVGTYKLINIDVDPEFGEHCKTWATTAITSYHKGEKKHLQDVAAAIKKGEPAHAFVLVSQ